MPAHNLVLDPFLIEVMNHKLKAVGEEMGLALSRLARSNYVKEINDFGTGLCGLNGKFFSVPTNLGVASNADLDCSATIALVPDLKPGDIIISNHPYIGGGMATHLPDVSLLLPVFHEGDVVCFCWNFVHCSDVGGGVPSSISPSFKDIFQEGLQIPPMKLVSEGRLDENIIQLFKTNSRIPDINAGDLQAQIAALRLGEARIHEIIGVHGVETVLAAQADLVEYARIKALRVQRSIPDGTYAFWDFMDDDYNTKIPVRLHCSMSVVDGKITLDLSQTDPQVEAAYNVPTGGRRHSFITAKFIHFLLTRDPEIPLNYGMLENISVIVPEGTIMNPVFPAAVGVRHATGLRFADVIQGCLAQAVPDMVPAANGGVVVPVVVGQSDASGEASVVVIQSLVGGGGAGPRNDGNDARDRGISNVLNTPVERTEEVAGVRVETYAVRPDSGGAGRHRGGTGSIFSIRALCDGIQVLGRGLDRFVFAPWGVQGGAGGATARVILTPAEGGAERDLGKIDVVHIRKGDLLTFLTPGGGGYGNPLERQAESVALDVRLGFVSVEAAAAVYGVVVSADGTVDREQTTAMRRSRSANGEPANADMRATWDEIFGPEEVKQLAIQLQRLAPRKRALAKASLMEKILPGITRHGIPSNLGTTDLSQVRAALRAELADRETKQ